METPRIIMPPLLFVRDLLLGNKVTKSDRKLSDLYGFFQDVKAYETIPPETLIYEVYSHIPGPDGGTDGAVNFGLTHIHPGKVGQEYFMTKGHFHEKDNRAEYYWGIEGEGVLILMDRKRNAWGEKMFPGSLHYIPGGVAHRVANTGNKTLSFAACWPSDAGHDYEEIARNGFSTRLIEAGGIPRLI